MNTEALIQQTERLINKAQTQHDRGVLIEAKEFLRVYAGKDSAFYKQIDDVRPSYWEIEEAVGPLKAFVDYIKNGLLDGVTPARKAQIDVVSDFLAQAQVLIETSNVHPAAPTVIIGAALEEYLRNWAEEQQLSLANKKPGIDSYAKLLLETDKITKQDIKDITSWAGLRNHAAHGEWEEVNDKSRITIMLEGINLFMRKYNKQQLS